MRIASPNKQLQRTVTRRRGRAASAPFHYALAPRITRQRAAAELHVSRHGEGIEHGCPGSSS